MSDGYQYLIGADDVKNAAHQMQGAADDMIRAASSMAETADRQRQFMTEWLDRLENILAANKP